MNLGRRHAPEVWRARLTDGTGSAGTTAAVGAAVAHPVSIALRNARCLRNALGRLDAGNQLSTGDASNRISALAKKLGVGDRLRADGALAARVYAIGPALSHRPIHQAAVIQSGAQRRSELIASVRNGFRLRGATEQKQRQRDLSHPIDPSAGAGLVAAERKSRRTA